jgi:hypothetical protein
MRLVASGKQANNRLDYRQFTPPITPVKKHECIVDLNRNKKEIVKNSRITVK